MKIPYNTLSGDNVEQYIFLNTAIRSINRYSYSVKELDSVWGSAKLAYINNSCDSNSIPRNMSWRNACRRVPRDMEKIFIAPLFIIAPNEKIAMCPSIEGIKHRDSYHNRIIYSK